MRFLDQMIFSHNRATVAIVLAAVHVLVWTSGAATALEIVPIPKPRPDAEALAVEIAPIPVPAPADRSLQGGVAITLADAIFIGLRENTTIKSAYINRVIQKFDLKVVEDTFTPRFGVSGLVARQSIGDTTSTVIDVSPGVNAKTPTGARFEFAWVNSSQLTDNSNSFASTAELGFEQPLLRGGGIKVNMAPIRQARLAEQANKQRLKATVAEVIGTIVFAHRDLLLAQEELKLSEAAVRRAEQLLSINASLIAAGRMAAMEAVQTEADLKNQRLRVLQARQRLALAQLTLLNLLALDLDTDIVARESLTPKKVPIDTRELLSVALVMRPDYLSQLYVIEQSKLGLVVAKNETLWDIDLFARGRFGIETASHQSSNTVADATIGLRFNIPLNDPVPQQQVIQSSTNLDLADLRLVEIRQGIETQIRGSVSEVRLLWEQFGVAEEALTLAKQAVEIEKAKLNAGRSSTFQVQLLEDRLRESETQLLKAQVGYFNALTRLDLQLGTTLETWRVDLRDGDY